jgi:hypothetical protein
VKDVDFIAAKFIDFEIPAEKQFLYKYFRTKIERSFIQYYFCFNGEYENFIDHVGLYCQMRWLRILKRRMCRILQLRDQAKSEMDFDKVAMIEKGRYFVESGEYKKGL